MQRKKSNLNRFLCGELSNDEEKKFFAEIRKNKKYRLLAYVKCLLLKYSQKPDPRL